MSFACSIPRLVVAGAASNVGKTTMTAGIISALRQQGLVVQPFKCGPDYIDPSYHERAAHRPCRNLDAWMLQDAQLLAGFARACRDADIAVIEGVMGLFDGSNWHDDSASTAKIAKLLGAPVLLVLDIAGAARSAAVTVLGCQQFDRDLALQAVVLNFAGSESHANGCAEAITSITGLPVLGWLPQDPTLRIPERHLGLVPGGEHADTNALIDRIGAQVTARFDLSALLTLARRAGEFSTAEPDPVRSRGASATSAMSAPILAVARDEAFCFYYPENLELLEQAGARIEYFSPLRGEVPGKHVAGVYLGGGYPELHAPRLAANVELWRSLAALHAADAPIYAECGGFMVLTQALIDREQRRWPMAGLIPGMARMTDRLAALGYRHASACSPNLLTANDDALRGHEFRYSYWLCDEPPARETSAWRVSATHGSAPPDSVGFQRGNLLASYLHIHFGQREDIATRFVDRLRAELKRMADRDHARHADVWLARR